MASITKNLVLLPFGNWTVLRFHGYPRGRAEWWCRCKCGTERAVLAQTLLIGQSNGCGAINCPTREHVVEGDIVRIPLTQGFEAIVDVADHESISELQGDWCAQWTGQLWYAVKRMNGRYMLMHRLITDAPKGMDVDHEDHNTMNNRRANLRICTESQNMMNMLRKHPSTSVYKGVNWDKTRNKWMVRVTKNSKRWKSGRFSTEVIAALQYDVWAREAFGEFALTNFPRTVHVDV